MNTISYVLFYIVCAVLFLYAGAACATLGWMVAYFLVCMLCAVLFLYAGWWAVMLWAIVTVGIIVHSVASGHWHGAMHGHGRVADWFAEHLHLQLGDGK